MMPSQHFVVATLVRLDALEPIEQVSCCLPCAKDDTDLCGASLCNARYLPSQCKAGLVQSRLHTAMLHTTAQLLKGAGAFVDIERPEPQLHVECEQTGKIIEAVMDLHVAWPGSASPRLVDVSVRTAQAERYRKASSCVAVAATEGEEDKLKRYNGRAMPLVFEAAGRVGPQSKCTLNSLVDDAVTAGFATPGILHYWRNKLNRTLTYMTADITLLALGWSGRRYCKGGSIGAAIHRSMQGHG